MNLTRKELYELAWSKPMTSLAKEHGFSDNGFAKICRRHLIPIPPRGYWAKIAAGFNVPKISLPPKNENVMVYIEARKPISEQVISNRHAKLIQDKTEIEKIGDIEIPTELSDPHKYTANTRTYFDKIIKKINAAKASKSLPNNLYDFYNLMPRGRIECHQNNCYKVTVSENLVNRALIFLDTLIKELEHRGFKVQPNKDDKLATSIIAIKDQEKIIFQISEGYKYQPIDKNSKQLSALEQWLYSDKQPVATGKLSFSAHTAESHIGRNWTDGKRLIEDNLPNIIHELISLAPRLKEHQIKEEEKRKLRLIELEIYREREAQRYREKSIFDEAIKEAQIFSEHLKLDVYLRQMEELLIKQHGNLPEEALTWITTVREVAKKINPISKRLLLLTS